MRLGVFTPLLSKLPLEGVLDKLAQLGVNTVELATGNYPGDAHCKLSMLDDAAALRTFQQTLKDRGFTISALSCHGNPLHPTHSRQKPRRRSAARQFCWRRSWALLRWLISPAVPEVPPTPTRQTG